MDPGSRGREYRVGQNGDDLNICSNFCLHSGQISVSLSLYPATLSLQPKTSLAQGMVDEFKK